MKVEPYLFFEGRAEEAINFYKSALGAEVTMLMRFKDAPQQPGCTPNPGTENKVMHANLRLGESNVLISDGRCEGNGKFAGFSVALSVATDAAAKKAFDALAEGGKIKMPLGKTFFSSSFGMVADRFGVTWMVLTGHE